MNKPVTELAGDAEEQRITQVRLRAPGPHEVLDAVLELSRAVTVDMHATKSCTHTSSFGVCFRNGCLRAHAPRGRRGADMVYATGRLRPDRRERIELTREAMQRHGVELNPGSASHITPLDGIGRSSSRDRRFRRADDGRRADRGRRVGRVCGSNVCASDDRPLIVQLALQLGARSATRACTESRCTWRLFEQAARSRHAPIMVMGRDGEVTFGNRAFLTITAFVATTLGSRLARALPETERRRLLPVYISVCTASRAPMSRCALPRAMGVSPRSPSTPRRSSARTATSRA